MRVPFLDLRRETEEIRRDLRMALDKTLDSGRFVLGEAVDRFEAEFARYCGARRAVGVASGTDAIAIALHAAGISPGAEVVTAANTCLATVAGIERAGARPVLADVDPRTLTLDPDAAAAAVTRRTEALLPVHLYGHCADMQGLRTLAQRHGLRLVEDAAHAHGAALDGMRAGSLGDVAAFSFYPTKNLGALGDGGAVVTQDEEIAARARKARVYSPEADHRGLAIAGSSRLDAVQSELLAAKLRFLEGWTARRRELAARYREALQETCLELPVEAEHARHVYHLFVVRARARDALRERLAEHGLETLVHYPAPVHGAPAYAYLAPLGSLPVSESAAASVLSLPLSPFLTDDEHAAVVAALAAAK